MYSLVNNEMNGSKKNEIIEVQNRTDGHKYNCSGTKIPSQTPSSKKMPEALLRQQKEDIVAGSTSNIWKDPPKATN